MARPSGLSIDLIDLRRAESIADKGGGVVRPLHDVDLLAPQFLDHRLHAHAAHAYAGANGIDGTITGIDGDLGASIGLSRAPLISMIPS